MACIFPYTNKPGPSQFSPFRCFFPPMAHAEQPTFQRIFAVLSHAWMSNRQTPRDLLYAFLQHTDDDSNTLTLPSDPPQTVRTTWTLLLYLTSSAEGCVGGETVFYPHDRQTPSEEIAVPLETGMLLLHKHGDDCLLVSQFSHLFMSQKVPGRWLSDCFLFSLLVTLIPPSPLCQRLSFPSTFPPSQAGTGFVLTFYHYLQHEGREVRNGEKWVLRTDLCVKK